jgi:LysR family glycine cleavage system transcriptional activator
MTTRLPPLNALRVFEAAGRHMSFRLAAQELRVTPGAVSQQIRVLELHLGVPLFERLPKGIRLSPYGEKLLPAALRALQVLSDAMDQLRSAKSVIQVTVAPTLCTRWLMPLLGRFYDRCPNVEVRIDATTQVIDLASNPFDVAIRYLALPPSNLECGLMFADTVFPVCSPGVAERLRGDPRRLAEVKLLAWSSHDHWTGWLREARLPGRAVFDRVQFSHLMLALDGAQAGQGIALCCAPLVRNELESGRLVRPFETSFETGFSYYVAARREALRSDLVRSFMTWVLTESKLEPQAARRS